MRYFQLVIQTINEMSETTSLRTESVGLHGTPHFLFFKVNSEEHQVLS